MAKQELLAPDTLPVARQKINDNFTEVYNNNTANLNNKVDKVTGKSLSENDYVDADKAKVDALPADLNAELAAKLPLAGGTMTGGLETANYLNLATVDSFGFESGDLITDGFTTEGASPWTVSSDNPNTGVYSAKNIVNSAGVFRLKKTISTGVNSLLLNFSYIIDIDTFDAGNVYLNFLINGVCQFRENALNTSYLKSRYFNIKGDNIELEWSITASTSLGTNAVYIDDIVTFSFDSSIVQEGVLSTNGTHIVDGDLIVNGAIKGSGDFLGDIDVSGARFGIGQYIDNKIDTGSNNGFIISGFKNDSSSRIVYMEGDRYGNVVAPSIPTGGFNYSASSIKSLVNREVGDIRYVSVNRPGVPSVITSQTNALIDAGGDKSIINKKYLTDNAATLVGGKIQFSQLPAISITEVFSVADIAARDALVIGSGDGEVQEGDMVIVADASADPEVASGSAVYVYNGSSYILIQLGISVNSVNGFTGAVSLAASDVPFTPNGDISSTQTQNAIVELRDDTDTKLSTKYDSSNPSGFETPSQLNARDADNRARANHTGTQVASTISDFSAAVSAYLNKNSVSVINTSITNNTSTFSDALNSSFSFNHVATYEVNFSWVWNYSANRNITIEGLIDGSVVFSLFSLPTDNGAFQRYPNSFKSVYNNTSAGNKSVVLRFRSEQNGDTATIYSRSIVSCRIT